MEVYDALVADQLDTVHHEMDSVFQRQHVYKSVWSTVKENNSSWRRSLLTNPHDESTVAVIKASLR